MALTIGNWVTIALIGLIMLTIVTFVMFVSDSMVATIIGIIISIAIIVSSAFAFNWFNTNTASGQRSYKDFTSDINGGIERELIITAEDGREIFRYEGKIDIESNHEDNYIKFESEEGKRHIIYYGITDTILIREK